MFICQVLCTGIQGIYALLIGGIHLPKYVYLPSIVDQYSKLYSQFWWGPSAKVGSSANFGVLVFKASLLDYPGGPSAKVCSSAKNCVLVFKAPMLY